MRRSCAPSARGNLLTVVKKPVAPPPATSSAHVNVPAPVPAPSDRPACAYRVFHCERSNKKHKSYSDGVLVVKGDATSGAVLYDDQGKEIARTSKATQVSGPGSTGLVGGREFEVDAQIEYHEFESGSVFMHRAPATAPTSAKVPTARARGFVPVLAGAAKAAAAAGMAALPAPRHDPKAEGALVLDAGGERSVAVVLDPHLRRHLREHQVDGVRFVYECLTGKRGSTNSSACGGCILADEMGLGKTLQAICVIWTLLKQGTRGLPTVKKAVVVCPNTLVANWAKEIRQWLGPERLKTLTLSDAKGKKECEQILKDFANDVHPLLVVSYEQIRANIDHINAVGVGLVVCDEAHRIKNPTSKTALALRKFSGSRKLLLTGTPVQNDLSEFYTMIDFCCTGLLGDLQTFRNTFERPIAAGNDPRASAEERRLAQERAALLAQETSSVVLRRLSTILADYLPRKTEVVLMCRPSEAQIALYKCCLSSQMTRDSFRDGGSAAALGCIQKLVKICNHPSILLSGDEERQNSDDQDAVLTALLRSLLPPDFEIGEKSDPQESLSGKLLVVDVMLNELKTKTREKVVLVSGFTKTLDVFERLCGKRGWAFSRLDGQTDKKKRQELVDRFNRTDQDGCFVFLLSCRAGGLGLNLCGASRLILFDSDWNPAWDRQSMARIWRDGQKREVWIYRLLTTGSIEEKIFQRQLSKQNLSRNVIADQFHFDKGFAREDLRAVFYLNEQTRCDTHDLIRCKCVDGAGGVVPSGAEHRDTEPDGMAQGCQAALARWKHCLDLSSVPDAVLQRSFGENSPVSFVFLLPPEDPAHWKEGHETETAVVPSPDREVDAAKYPTDLDLDDDLDEPVPPVSKRNRIVDD